MTDQAVASSDDVCDCEFDYPEPDGGESWHFTRICPRCEREWGALNCVHDRPDWVCRDCDGLHDYPGMRAVPMDELRPMADGRRVWG